MPPTPTPAAPAGGQERQETALETVVRWVSVGAELPHSAFEVLVFLPCGWPNVYSGRYRNREWWVKGQQLRPEDCPTHWAELPEGPTR